MGKAIIDITPELLFEMLKLPDNIKYVACNYNFKKQEINILVESDEIEDTPEGGVIPIASVVLKTEIYKVTTFDSINVCNKTIEPINMCQIPATIEVIS